MEDMDMLDMLDMVDTHTDTDMLDIMASVKLMLSLRPRPLLTPTFCMEDMDMPDTIWDMLDMLDTHTVMDMLDTTASVRLMLSPRPRLIPIFCMEVMAMAMPDTLAMLDIMDIPMLDMPTMDKLQPPKQEMDRATIILFFFSDHKISVLDFIFW